MSIGLIIVHLVRKKRKIFFLATAIAMAGVAGGGLGPKTIFLFLYLAIERLLWVLLSWDNSAEERSAGVAGGENSVKI